MKAVKSEKRHKQLKKIVAILKHGDIFDVIDYKSQAEGKIKQFIYPHLLGELTNIYIDDYNIKKETARERAKENLLWEGNVKTTVNNMLFLGVQHRPDMEIKLRDIRIAIEIKRGESGSAIREGIGQVLVYTNVYHFVIFLFIDTSKDKQILNSIKGDKESKFIRNLWTEFNVMFEVV